MATKRKSRPFSMRFLVRGSLRYAKNSAKNCVRLLIGRRPSLTPKDQFFRQYVRELLGIEPIRKITCIPPRAEGAGSQAYMLMGTINFARQFGFTYVHTPFSDVAHADRPMTDWAAAWEKQFNLGAGEVLSTGKGQLLDLGTFTIPELCELFGVRDLSRVLNVPAGEFRRKYFLNKTRRKNDVFTIAVHVRRGDSLPDNREYYTPNEVVLRTIMAVKAALDARGVRHRVRVYSQGEMADFAELTLSGVEFFLDADAIWTMEQLIEADVLIMAKGRFSYVAGLISEGIKISGGGEGEWQGWYPPPPDECEDWIFTRADGALDVAVFGRRLDQVIRSKPSVVI